MTVLFSGSESEAFPGNMIDQTDGNGGNQCADRTYSHRKLSQSATLLGTGTVASFGSIAEAWFHFRLGDVVGSASENATRTVMLVRNSSGVGVVRLQNTTGPVRTFQYWDGAAWQNIGTVSKFTTVSGRTVDLHVKIANSGGEFSLYIDGQLQQSFTGDTDLYSGSAIFDLVLDNWGQFNGRSVSEVIVSTVSTLHDRNFLAVATGNSSTNTAWTGDYTAIDERANLVTTIDADFITSSATGQFETFTKTTIAPMTSNGPIKGVTLTARARNNGGGGDFEFVLRIGSTNYTKTHSGPAIASAFNSGFYACWDVSPATGVAWTASEINSLEFGVHSITASNVDVSKINMNVVIEKTGDQPWEAGYTSDAGMEIAHGSCPASVGFFDVVSPTLQALGAMPKAVLLISAFVPAGAVNTFGYLGIGSMFNAYDAALQALSGTYWQADDAALTSNYNTTQEFTTLGTGTGGGQDNVQLIRLATSNTRYIEFAEFIPGGVRIYNDNTFAFSVTCLIIWGDDLDVDYRLVNLGTGTSAIATTGLGFAPDALIAWHMGVGAIADGPISIGVAADPGTGLEQRAFIHNADDGDAAGGEPYSVIYDTFVGGFITNAGALAYSLTLNSLDADGFTITPSASAVSTLLRVLSFRHPTKKFNVIDITTPTATGSFNHLGVGFTPGMLVGMTTSLQALNTISSDAEPASSFGMFMADQDLTQATMSSSDNSTTDPTDCNRYNDIVNMVRIGTNNGTVNEVVGALTGCVSDGITVNYTAASGTAKLGFGLVFEGISGFPPGSPGTSRFFF